MPVTPSGTQVSGAIIIAVATGIAFYLWNRKCSPKRTWRAVATVAQLKLYPLKSCNGVKVDRIQCQKDGAQNKGTGMRDRSFILSYCNGQMITARQQPPLVLVTPNFLSNGSIELSAPGIASIVFSPSSGNTRFKVRVWGSDGLGVDCGKKVGEWFKTYLKLDEDVRLLYHDQPEAAFKRDALLKFPEADVYTEDLVHATYQDYAPVSLLSESSVKDLQSRVGIPISERNFRPNVYLVGCGAYDEDSWRYIRIGSTEMKFVKHCSRCVLTTVDPDKGEKNNDMEPLKTLKQFRLVTSGPEKDVYMGAPIFSDDFVPVKSGEICVGDTVYVSTT